MDEVEEVSGIIRNSTSAQSWFSKQNRFCFIYFICFCFNVLKKRNWEGLSKLLVIMPDIEGFFFTVCKKGLNYVRKIISQNLSRSHFNSLKKRYDALVTSSGQSLQR